MKKHILPPGFNAEALETRKQKYLERNRLEREAQSRFPGSSRNQHLYVMSNLGLLSPLEKNELDYAERVRESRLKFGEGTKLM